VAKQKAQEVAPPDCWCHSGLPRSRCCEPILQGKLPAATAQALMRSRFSAFATNNASYLLHSWHPNSRPSELTLDSAQRWLGLKITRCDLGGEQDDTGLVEFVARYKINGRGQALRELSEFCRYQGRWVYLRGSVPS